MCQVPSLCPLCLLYLYLIFFCSPCDHLTGKEHLFLETEKLQCLTGQENTKVLHIQYFHLVPLLQPPATHPPLHCFSLWSQPFHNFESGHRSGYCSGGQALPIAWRRLAFCHQLWPQKDPSHPRKFSFPGDRRD